MTLRKRLFVLYVSLFSLVLVGVFGAIYAIYAEFREEVFYERLNARIVFTTRLLFEVRDMDAHLMKIIDEKTIHRMYDEKILLFDTNNRIVYSSLDDAEVEYSPHILATIRREGEWRQKDGDKEILGLHYMHNGKDYIALASATDVSGLRMIDNLLLALGLSFLVGVAIIVATSRYFINKTLAPVIRLSGEIGQVSPNTLHRRLMLPEHSDELSSIAGAFNQTLERLQVAFDFQKNFVHYASHELNTPISVIHAVLERMRYGQHTVQEYATAVEELWKVHEKLADILASLLFLSSLDELSLPASTRAVRVDEVLFEAVEELVALHPDAKLLVDFHPSVEDESVLMVKGSVPLLRTAIRNVLENGWKYSTDGKVTCTVAYEAGHVQLAVRNTGEPIPADKRHLIFEPFFRLPSATGIQGRGLGLAMVHRIVKLHHGTIAYNCEAGNGNVFVMKFPIGL